MYMWEEMHTEQPAIKVHEILHWFWFLTQKSHDHL